jgi:hypothetical protein
MTNPINGLPATVQNSLPAVVNVSSSTFATPIVITTAAAHNLTTGDYFTVVNANDPNAVGTFRAGVVAATTVQLLNKTTGAAIVGTLAGGASGTLTNDGFGVTFPILSDGDPPSAALWNVPYAALANFCAWLMYDKASRTLGTIFTGAATFKNSVALESNVEVTGSLNLGAAATVNGNAGTVTTLPGLTKLTGRKALRRARVLLADASQAVNVSQGDTFDLSSAPVAARVITLTSTGANAPSAGESLEFICNSVPVAGDRYTFQREDLTVVATFTGPPTITALNSCNARFDFTGGVWRLGANSGNSWDPDGAGADYGVLPGAGA